MRRIWIPVLFAALILSGCGGKKRSFSASSARGAESIRTAENASSTVIPEDKGKFVFISVDSPDEYIQTFSRIAQSEMRTYGIPASITLAQGLLESGFGRGELTRKTNNHFGIKCHTGWEGEYEEHDDDERGECFRKYNHPIYSFRDHSIFLSSRSRYASLFELKKDDYKGWARGLKAAGYATDRRYPAKLIELVERYRLDRFDAEVLGKRFKPGRAYLTHKVEPGDTLFGLSRKYGLSVEEIMKLNSLEDSSISVGQILRVQPEKARK
ncbi:Flagellum-specific peptidoglycan hydrolase FlgJ [Robiginitalea myxolifaciens]|uniref:Peptidoglycan hydrolase n=1 Tax=Robiginitalea myxolifaciens TaxID=400055 RepID=A0A1I6GD25_9FLAO|nr:glucosaminidase domain-containing protein [Robiginitalea myxolifaciens]SFR40085.1 Flagellum-specific peptidoglycan hydrolase FlgJ [Robiginitalea myxolifaciens]